MTGGHGVNKEEVDGTVCSAVQCKSGVVLSHSQDVDSRDME